MMQEQEVLATPYKGDKPYIFISYSHKDRDEAVKVIRLLQRNRYRVWYDEGIDPGTEWDENIAEHIKQCEYFLALISPNSVTSSNCRDEIKYARDLDKPRALVYLTDTQLPAAMQMRLGRLQAVYKYKYASEDAFVQKLLEAKGIEACYEEEDKILNWMKEEFDLNGIVNGIVGDSSELDEDDLDLEDDWNGKDEKLNKFQNLDTEELKWELKRRSEVRKWLLSLDRTSRILDTVSQIKWWKVGLAVAMYFIGFHVNGEMIFRTAGLLNPVVWVLLYVLLYLVLSVLWFNMRDIQRILPLVKNKKIGWQMLGYVLWSLVIIAVVTIVEGIIFTID